MKHRLLQIWDFLTYTWWFDDLNWWLTILGFLVGFLALAYTLVVDVWTWFVSPDSTLSYYALIAFAIGGASFVIGNGNRRLWLHEHGDWIRP